MDFLLPEKSRKPHRGGSTLPTWDSWERTAQHLFTCYWGAKRQANYKACDSALLE